jgi:hypothetical protein
MINVVFATSTARVMTPDGAGRMVVYGEHWPADDPVVLAQPSLFSVDPRHGLRASVEPAGMDEPPVETVTAGPGEKRGRVHRG